MKTALLRVLMIAAALLCGTVHAAGQDVPESVMAPYRAYLEAYEADDGEAAARLAEAAYRAGRSADIDAGMLAALAENRAQSLADIGRMRQAARAFDDLAEVTSQAGSDAIQLASVHLRAGEAYAAARAERPAERRFEQALEVLGSEPDSADLALARWTMLRQAMNFEWGGGRVDRAGGYALQAISLAESNPVLRADRRALSDFAFVAAVHEATRWAGRRAPPGDSLNTARYFLISHAAATAAAAADGEPVDELRELWARANFQSKQGAERDAVLAAVLSPPFGELFEGVDLNAMHLPPSDEPGTRVPPQYPQGAMQRRMNGMVLLRFDIDDRGRTTNIEALDSVPHPVFVPVSIEAVRQFIYPPSDPGDGIRSGVVTSFSFAIEQRR